LRVGVPTEIKPQEGRVGLTPAGVRELVSRGHEVVVEAGARRRSRLPDSAFADQGATIAPNSEAVCGWAEMIVKVKEPQPGEVAQLQPHHTLFTYLHLAAEPALAHGLAESGATCIAYETVEDDDGQLPLFGPIALAYPRFSRAG